MRRLTLMTTLLGLAVLTLSACASAPAGPTSSATSSASNSPSPSASPQAAALVLSLTELEVVDADGNRLGSADLDEGDDIGALVRQVLGAPTSTSHDSTYGFDTTRWDGLALGTGAGSSDVEVHFLAAHSGAIALRSSDGVSVGMTRAQVIAAGATMDTSFTDDKNRLNELFVSQRKSVPGTTSLTHSGQTGSIFVEAVVTDGVVSTIVSPGNDFSDL
ncbi:MAG: hypothetical protein BGO04_06460 [Microbacterium sp. 70-38]|nr:MAG: hypothetical protein BGO04_06460 [Microbacterium sp. 70-38]